MMTNIIKVEVMPQNRQTHTHHKVTHILITIYSSAKTDLGSPYKNLLNCLLSTDTLFHLCDPKGNDLIGLFNQLPC